MIPLRDIVARPDLLAALVGAVGTDQSGPATRASLAFEAIAWPVCATLAERWQPDRAPPSIGVDRVWVEGLDRPGGMRAHCAVGPAGGGAPTVAREALRTLEPLAAALGRHGPRRASMYRRAVGDRLVLCAWEHTSGTAAWRLALANRVLDGADRTVIGAARHLHPGPPVIPRRRVCCLSHDSGSGRCLACPRAPSP